MKGFFSLKETKSESRPDGRTYSCASCGLIKHAQTPKMKPYGGFKKKILIVGSVPSSTDDRKGKPWQGTSGRWLAQSLQNFGIDLFEDCLSTFSVCCHPNKQAIGSYQIACCRKSIIRLIKEKKPKIIIAFGQPALEGLIGHKRTDTGEFGKWRGYTIPDQDYQAWICPVHHPSHADNANLEIRTIWDQDMKRALSLLNTPFPVHVEPTIEVITDLNILDTIKGEMVAIDYETTGLKPHAKGHRIVCISVADSKDHCYVFMTPSTRIKIFPFIRLLKNKTIGKVAQNMKFEHNWSFIRLRASVENWIWDTMLASHQLDNRTGTSGLKFQTYVQFGIADYSSEISPYLQAVEEKNGNSHNRILDLLKTKEGEDKLLHYCGLDTIFGFRLAVKQRIELEMDEYFDLPF